MPTAVRGPAYELHRASSGGMKRIPGPASQAVRGVAALLGLTALVGGLPTALDALGGFPVPRRLPPWHEVIITLGRPDNGSLFIGAVRWVSWLAWAVFAICALAELAAQVRGRSAPRLPVLGPVQALASALIGAVMMGLLPGTGQIALAAPPSGAGRAVAIVPELHHLASPGSDAWQSPKAGVVPDNTAGQAVGEPRGLYTVREGDNLWEIAARHLGDAEHWHEIFALNQGRPQPDGHRLTDPNLIYPGWILALPSRASAPKHARPGERPGKLPARSGHTPDRHRTIPPGPHRRNSHPQAGRPHGPRNLGHPVRSPGPRQRSVGINLPGGGLVGVTLAAAISTALVAWRLHRRRVAVPRWPSPPASPEPDVPGTIRALRRAHLRSLAADTPEAHGELWPGDTTSGDVHAEPTGADDDDELDEFGAPVTSASPQPTTAPTGASPHLSASHLAPRVNRAARTGASSAVVAPAAEPPAPASPGWQPAPPARPLPAGTVAFGTRGSTEIPLTDVARPALALAGPGASAVGRALMVGLLAAAPPDLPQRVQVIIPANDFRTLTGTSYFASQVPGETAALPDSLIVTVSLPAALDLIETEITRHQRPPGSGRAGADDRPPGRSLALIATVDRQSATRVRAILEADAGGRLTSILLGHSPTACTCVIGIDGLVIKTTDPALAGVQAYHLPAAATTAMLTLLRDAQGHLTPEHPSQADQPGGHPFGGRRPTQVTPSGPDASQNTGGDSAGRPDRDRNGTRDHGQPPAAVRHLASEALPQPLPPDDSPGRAEPGSRSADAPEPPASAATPPSAKAAGKPVTISVLGSLRITANGMELAGGLRKARELLAYLAVHPDGATGERISADLWPESTPRHAVAQRTLALRKAREMLRTATAQPADRFITLTSDRYRLNPALTDTDLWHFDDALTRAQAATSQDEQLAALWQAAALYRGSLADGAGYDWADDHAEHARRRAVDALARIAALLQECEPEQALNVLETAITHDPYNEAIYQQVIRIQIRLGRPDAARRTLALLKTRLAGLGLNPDPATLQAARTLPR